MMSSLPSLCFSASAKNQQPLEMPGPDQNQDSNAILPPINLNKGVNSHTLNSQNPVIRMPQSGRKMQYGPRSSRQFPTRMSGGLPLNSSINSGAPTNIPTSIDQELSGSSTLKPQSPLKSFQKRNRNAKQYKNNNIILPPLDDINSIEDNQSDLTQKQQFQTDDKVNYIPSDVGGVYVGNGNEISDGIDEEEEEEADDLFIPVNSGRLENASNRVDDDINLNKNRCYSFQVSDPKFSS